MRDPSLPTDFIRKKIINMISQYRGYNIKFIIIYVYKVNKLNIIYYYII